MKNTVFCLVDVVENVANFAGVLKPLYVQFYEDLVHIDLVSRYGPVPKGFVSYKRIRTESFLG